MSLYRLAVLVFLLLCFAVSPHQIWAAPASPAIVINLPSRTLAYYDNDELIKEYPVAIGSVSTPTPLGTFRILEKETNPVWYPPGKDCFVPSGPANPLGYRWLGFLPTYGIHGTNMPWSIGSVSSNGCIRMLEADVEELFTMADCQTPVQITYDRIKIRIDKSGNASLGIYPDVYGYQPISLTDIHNRLTACGLDGLAEESLVAKLLREQPDEQFFFAQVYRLKVNGKLLTEHVAAINDTLYAPVMAIAARLNSPLSWDESNRLIIGNRTTVPGLLKGRTVYVRTDDLSLLFGGRQLWDPDGSCLLFQVPTLFFAGQPISSSVQLRADGNLIPALAVAKALQQKVTWDEKRQTLSNAIRRIPVTVIDGEPYLADSRLGEYFNASVQRDETMQILELNYPRYDLDLSMYLDWWGECFD
ncbi:MAG: L,D-transpeptidase family protein [Veillonellales bacterium]